jgi:hypothetical protein
VRHLEHLQDLSRSSIDLPQFALVTFPGAVPQLAIDPGDACNDAVGLDRPENRSCSRIDLVDLAALMLSHPECPFGPGKTRVTATTRRRDRREHTASLRVDLLDAIPGNLKQVLAVEGRSCMRGDINRAQHLSAHRIEGVQLVSGSKPDMLTVKRNPMDVVGTRKGTVFTENFGR